MRGCFQSALLWLSASTLATAAPAKSYETVQTSNGPITGHRAGGANDVWEYLGIPYAQPPLNDLRFAAPQKYKGKGPYTAINYVSDYQHYLKPK